MYNIKKMHESLKVYCSGSEVFDKYRLVEPNTHLVYDYDKIEGKLKKAKSKCCHVWKRPEFCENCISRQACSKNKQFFKIEFLENKVFMVFAVPVFIEGKKLALELIKDVTDSMMVASDEKGGNAEISQMVTQLNNLAVRDIFTGLYNRIYVINEITKFLYLSTVRNSGKKNLSGAYINVDDFRTVNDMYGHITGDYVILHIAAVIKSIVKKYGGWAGRMLGAEFVIMFENMTKEEVNEAVVEISNRLETFRYKAQDDKFGISISWGVGTADKDETAEAFLDRLDKIMCRNRRKKLGIKTI